jgi:hypothetical protein
MIIGSLLSVVVSFRIQLTLSVSAGCADVSWPRCTEMYYATRRFHQRQKLKFGVLRPDELFMETTEGPPEHKK